MKVPSEVNRVEDITRERMLLELWRIGTAAGAGSGSVAALKLISEILGFTKPEAPNHGDADLAALAALAEGISRSSQPEGAEGRFKDAHT
ncbi:MAG: hypothetical protein MRY74_14540 [Neomegalonema sp.]|nr:hypothetical protein [Neomegalonema sp.]